MFRQFLNMIKTNRAQSPIQEPLQPQHNSSLDWQPLDVSKLNLTSQRLREIEASMAEKTRAEFAAVTKQLNSNQLSSTSTKVKTD
jgi:hypothetical protein